MRVLVALALMIATTPALAQFPPPGIYGCEDAAGTKLGTLSLLVAGERLSREDLLITREASAGGPVESQGGITVMLDTQITPELYAEGLARELVNRIQNLRKQAGLDVSQRIRLVLACDGVLGEVADSETLGELIVRTRIAPGERLREDVPHGD